MQVSDLDSLVSQVRTAARLGRALGNAATPAVRAGLRTGRRLYNYVASPAKKKRKRSVAASGKRRKVSKKGRKRRKMRISYQGKMGPNFPAMVDKKKVAIYQRMGYLIEYETGGAVSDPNAVYLAHGVPTRVLFEAICGGFTRKVLNKFGLSIKGWEIAGMTGSVEDKFFWTLQVQAGPTAGVANTNSATVTGNQTAINLAIALADLFMTVTSAGQRFQEFIELRCIWTRRPAATDDYREEARYLLSDINVDVMCRSYLTLQNRTEAVRAQVSETDQTSMLDVAHNPLIGRTYFGKTTQINMKSMDSGSTNDFISIDRLTGFDSQVNGAALATVGIKKLPYWNDLTHVYGSTNTYLKAGEIRDSVFTYMKKYKCAKILQTLLDYMSTATTSAAGTNATMFYWPCRMLGFEKKIDSRTGGQPDIVVAYQTGYTLGAMVSVSKRNAPLRVIAA